jgi:hypothetical protein
MSQEVKLSTIRPTETNRATLGFLVTVDGHIVWVELEDCEVKVHADFALYQRQALSCAEQRVKEKKAKLEKS